MKLSSLAAKPKLVKIEIADADTIKEFGESLEYWTWDVQPAEIYFKLATLDSTQPGDIINVIRELIFDEDGRAILVDGQTLPFKLMMRVVETSLAVMGNDQNPTGEKSPQS